MTNLTYITPAVLLVCALLNTIFMAKAIIRQYRLSSTLAMIFGTTILWISFTITFLNALDALDKLY